MAFKNLEQRFNERVTQLYAGATLKFDNGKRSGGNFDEPFIARRPGDGYFGLASRALGRFLPTTSAFQDVKRLTLFSFNPRGIIFLAKQYLLQTGNTFEQTRLLNPAFAIGAAGLPGAGNIVRIRRHLNPRNTIFTKTDTSYPKIKELGLLQETTYDKNFLGTPSLNSIRASLRVPNPLGGKRNIGEREGIKWETARPELIPDNYNQLIHYRRIRPDASFKYGGVVVSGSVYGYSITAPNLVKYYGASTGINIRDYQISPTSATSKPDTKRLDLLSPTGAASTLKTREGYVATEVGGQQTKYQQGKPEGYLKYFSGGINSINGQLRTGSTDPRKPSNVERPISYIKDPSNVTSSTLAKRLPAYQNLPTSFDDPIVVSFAMGNDDPVQFRAFIKDLDQSISPEYKSSQYIGRIEKFVSYVSVQRELSFKLLVLAFSKTELDVVWTRINFLTGLAYPYGYNRGIMQPNIVRLTLGNLYVNQPGYITNLSTNFADVGESWDIDSEVPIGAAVSIKFTIIEKRTATANAPLYGITENISGFTTSTTLPLNTSLT